MTIFECCWSCNDPESWTPVDAADEEHAAERYVERHCADEGFGRDWAEDITVRSATTHQHLGLFTVTVEYEPQFSARRKGGA